MVRNISCNVECQMSECLYCAECPMSSAKCQMSKCVTPHPNCCLSIREESSIFRSNRPGWNFNEHVRLSFKFGVFLEFIIKILPWGAKLQLINCFVAAPMEMAAPNSVGILFKLYRMDKIYSGMRERGGYLLFSVEPPTHSAGSRNVCMLLAHT